MCRKLSLPLLAVIALSGIVIAQQITASIRGVVNDPSGAFVQNASVSARQTETGLTRTVATDRNGAYVLLQLPVGHYQLAVEAKDFQKYLQEGISLDVNQAATINVRLSVGRNREQVRVQADAQLIQTTDTSLGETVLQRDILDLPLNGRNFSQLGLLQPGVVPLTPGLQEASGTLRNGQGYAVNGQRPESNNFLIDGANNFNSVDAGFVMEPPIDAIAEFKILTHGANAEFGHSSGSTTNIVTRSGSNAFHGTAWEFLRNDKMDARNYFADQVEPLKQNQFGGTFGGPILHDKTFFFAYYEGFRNRQGETGSATVPSVDERQGDFSELCTSQAYQFDSNGQCFDPNPQTDHPPAAKFQLFNGFTGGTPIPYNQLPGIDPIAQKILPFFPLPNRPDNTFTTTQTLHQDDNQFGGRIDHYLSPSDALNFRYMFRDTTRFDPLSTSGANLPGFPVGESHRAQNFVAQETHTFSPTLVAVARFSFLRYKFLFDEHLNHMSLADWGFQYSPSLALASGPPFLQINGYSQVGDPITGPRNTYQNSFDYSGSLSWIRGRHELTFGSGYERDQINALQGIASNGFFVFTPQFPIINDAFAAFLSGAPIVFLQGGGDLNRNLRGNALNWYAQDTFKATSRLTLNYGLRYELPFPYTELKNRQNLWIPGRQSVVMPNAPAGLLYPGDPGVPAGLIPTDKRGFAPRVGLALDPTGSGRWLVTSAYGIFYEPYYTGQGGPIQDAISAPPYLKTPQVVLPNWADPFNGSNPFIGPGFSTPMTLLVLNPKIRLPYAQDWNLTIQHSFGADWLAEVGYVGTKGTHLPRFIEANPAIYIPGQSSENNVEQRRQYAGCSSSGCNFASVGEIAGISSSTYNALESSLRKRFGHGLSFLASYTYSKAIDDVSSFNITGSAAQPVAGENDLAQNPFDLAAERGRSMFDARHRLVFSYEWILPFWNHPHTWYQHALGNWQVNGIATLMSGTPFTVFDSNDPSLQGSAPEITGFSANRPNLVGNPNAGPRTVQEWFNTSAFQPVVLDPNSPVQQFGNAGRNIVQGPGYANWDFSVFRDVRLGESKQLQFRAEFFNLLNHTNLRLPNSDISNPKTFGTITEALPPRLTQLALKFMF